MTHPAVYIVSIGLALGAVVFAYFQTRQHESPYSYGQRNNRSRQKDDFCMTDSTTCTICMADMNDEKAKTYLNCGHNFHTKCIRIWLNNYCNDSCPICRERIK